MAIVRVDTFGGATVTLRDDDCQCSPEEMAKRRRELDRFIAELLQQPAVRENLRRINRERYGIEG